MVKILVDNKRFCLGFWTQEGLCGDKSAVFPLLPIKVSLLKTVTI